MRQIQIASLAVGLLVALDSRACAGLYDVIPPKSPFVSGSITKPLHYELFRDELDRLTAIADPKKPSGPRAAEIKKRDILLARGFASLSATDMASLGALQWRLRDGEAALTTLKQATIRDSRSFWALTNLGSVHQSLGQLREALSSLEEARDHFPDPWPGDSPPTGAWYKQAESCQFKLLRLRLKESMSHPAGTRPKPAADVDGLFDVRFAGPSGQYEGGKIADAEKAKLPKDAIALVQQLLLWFPEDTRLIWLLGELYNADGNLEAASKMFDMCVWSRRYESPTLRDHRRAVQDALDEAKAKAAQQASAPTGAPPSALSILPSSWQVYTVGAVFGVLLLALIYWQVSELLRRMRRRPIE